MALLALCLAYLGFAFISVAIDRHGADVLGRRLSLPWSRTAKAVGWLALAASIAPCVALWGLSIGLSAWFGVIALVAMVLVLLLTYAPRVAGACALASPLGLLAAVP